MIEAQNMRNLSRASDTMMIIVASMFFLFLNIKVMMTSKIIQCHGKYDELAPALTNYVWVEFNDQYKGPTYLPNYESWSGWVYVHSINTIWWSRADTNNGYNKHGCMIAPLKLCW